MLDLVVVDRFFLLFRKRASRGWQEETNSKSAQVRRKYPAFSWKLHQELTC